MKRYLTSFSMLLLVSIMIFTNLPALSQEQDQGDITDGTEYWIGVPHCRISDGEPIRNGLYPIMLWLSSKYDTRASITINCIGYTKTVQITKHKTTIIELDDLLMNRESEVKKDLGIHIKGDDPLTVCVYMSYKWSGEAFRCIPTEWLGTEYVTTNLYLDRTDKYRPPQILIIATEDKTRITYYPTAHTVKVDKGGAGSVTLNRGQTFLIEGRIKGQEYLKQDWVTDLTGTYIKANKPIAVISGHTKGAYPRYQAGMPTNYQLRWANFLRNMLVEMVWPIELLGNEYVTAPIKYFERTRGLSEVQDDFGDLIRFVATEDGTIVYQMRQDGSSYMQISRVMKKGEWHNINNQEFAALYKSNKPVLAAQYGKTWMNEPVPGGADDFTKKKGDEPQNPHLCGQGMLLVLPPIDHWCSYAQFRSPAGMDNFVYITFKDDDKFHIKYDGQPLTAKFGTATRPIYGSEYSYITETVPAGDHSLTADSGAKFAAYAYGNWDRLKDGFAYGYPTGINYASPCIDTLYVLDEMVCGDVVGTAIVEPEDSSCAVIFNVLFRSSESYNYDFDVEEFDRKEAKIVKFWLYIIDVKDSAKGVVTVLSRSGKSVTKTYIYIPEQIEADPDYINFGLLSVNEKKCVNVTLRNPGNVNTTVKSLRLKANRPEFSITPTNLPVTILPGEEVEIEVCATALAIYEKSIRDTIIAELSCFEEDICALELTSGEAIIWISDADWGQVPVGVEKPHDVIIENQGTVPAEVYTIDWPDKLHFPRISGLPFPEALVLKPGEEHTFTAYYIPDVPGVQHTTRADFTATTDQIKLYSDWTGIGILAGPLCEGHDWGKRRVLDAYADPDSITSGYKWSVMIDNTGNTKLDVKSVKIENDLGGVFRIDDSKVPQQLNPNSPIYIDAFFAPKEGDGIEEYQTKVIFTAVFNYEDKIAEGILHGIETQPHVDIEGEDFGDPILVGTSKTGEGSLTSAIVSNLSAMELEVTNLIIEGPDASAFAIDPQFFVNNPYPIILQPEQSLTLPYIFTAQKPGEHRATITTVSDAPVEASDDLIGRGMTHGIVPTNWDFGVHFITKPSGGQVTLENTGSVAAAITDALIISGNDYNEFVIDRYFLESTGEENLTIPFNIPPGDKLICDVTFTSQDVRDYSAKIDYTTSVGDATSYLWGEGMILKTVCEIPKYTMFPGTPKVVEVKITKHAEETKPLEQAGVTAFRVFIYFNTENPEVIDIYPEVAGPQDIDTDGTMTQGWNITFAGIINKLYLLVEFESSSGQPLAGSGTLFKFWIRSYLSDLNNVPLPVSFEPSSAPWVEVTNIPGSITVQPVCANTLRLIRVTNVPFELFPCKPNPVTEVATIEYSVGLEVRTTIKLFNTFGQKVATFVDEVLKPGHYELNFNVNALGLSSGVYQYRIESGPFKETKTMVISK